MEPEKIIGGDTYSWTVTDYSPDDSWALVYTLANETNKYTVAGVDDAAGGFTVTLTAAVTANWKSGEFSWQLYAQRNLGELERHTIRRGSVQIISSVFSGPSDGRTHAKRMLDAIEAVLEKRATTDQEAYTIAGRSLTRIPIPDLIVLQSRYKRIYAQELAAENLGDGVPFSGRIQARFI